MMNDPSHYVNSRHPISANPDWPLLSVMQALLLEPERLLAAYQEGILTSSQVLFYTLIFLLSGSLFFALTAVLHLPEQWHLSPTQMVVRFLIMLGVTIFLGIPLMTLTWGLLQKISGWFWNTNIPLVKALGIAGLGIFYYAMILFVSLPIFLFMPVNTVPVQGILFGLNIAAFIMSIRLFKQAYCVMVDASPLKALWVSLFPLVIIGLIFASTEILTYFAVQPYMKSH